MLTTNRLTRCNISFSNICIIIKLIFACQLYQTGKKNKKSYLVHRHKKVFFLGRITYQFFPTTRIQIRLTVQYYIIWWADCPICSNVKKRDDKPPSAACMPYTICQVGGNKTHCCWIVWVNEGTILDIEWIYGSWDQWGQSRETPTTPRQSIAVSIGM